MVIRSVSMGPIRHPLCRLGKSLIDGLPGAFQAVGNVVDRHPIVPTFCGCAVGASHCGVGLHACPLALGDGFDPRGDGLCEPGGVWRCLPNNREMITAYDAQGTIPGMFGSLPAWIDKAAQVVSRIRPPISAKVTYLRYDEVDNPPGSSLAVLKPYPWRYSATVELVNVSREPAYVKSIALSIDGGATIQSDLDKPLRLEPREPLTKDIIFPMSARGGIDQGAFGLEAVPSIGRRNIFRGTFPL